MIFIVNCNVELVLIILLHLPPHCTPVTVIVVRGPMPYIQEQVEPFLGLDVIALTAVCVI